MSWRRYVNGGKTEVCLHCPQSPTARLFKVSVVAIAQMCKAHPAADNVIPTPAEQQLSLVKCKKREDASPVTAQYSATHTASGHEHA